MLQILVSLILITVFIVLLISAAVRKRREWLLNFLLRGVLGTVVIAFLNLAGSSLGLGILVGINPITVLTCGILGFPGLLALYGIEITRIL